MPPPYTLQTADWSVAASSKGRHKRCPP